MTDEEYWIASTIFAWVLSTIMFATTWGYCINHYGFLVGVGSGWVPALIIGLMTWISVYVLWPVMVAGVTLFVVFGTHLVFH